MKDSQAPLTPDPASAGDRLRFGPFLLDPVTGELHRQGRPVALQPQPARILQYLAERSGEVVTRTELQHWLWGDDRSVDPEHGLNYCILQVRRALGDEADRPTFVETIPRRGYRFLVPASRESRLTGPRARPGWRTWLLTGALALALGGLVWLRLASDSGPAPERMAVSSFGSDPRAAVLRDLLVSRLVAGAGDGVAIVAAPPAATGLDPAVDLLLEGSLVSGPDGGRIRVRLLRGAHGIELWSATLPADVSTASGAEAAADAVADAVVAALASLPPRR